MTTAGIVERYARNLRVVAQPIFDTTTGRAVGVEMLSRFGTDAPEDPTVPTDEVFARAHAAGYGVELELAAIAAISAALVEAPDRGFVSVNVSAQAMADPRCAALLQPLCERSLVVELTEQTPVDAALLCTCIEGLRARGARLALDDIGTAYSALRLLLVLRPEIVKLDRSILAGIDGDPHRRALARAAQSFAAETGTVVVAEGIQAAAELDAVREVGISWAQGFLLQEPAPLERLPPL